MEKHLNCGFAQAQKDYGTGADTTALALEFDIKIVAIFGLVASLLSVWTGDGSGYQIAQTQPMKLAAVEGLYEGGTNVGLGGIGVLNPEKKTYNDGKDPFLFRFEIPSMLSFLAERNVDGYVPGITNIIEGGYQQKDGSTALSAAEKIERGKTAIGALAAYRAAKSAGHEEDAQIAYKVLQENIPYFGYGYIKDVNQLVPNVPLNFYAFRVMVILGGYFILFFIVVLFFIYKKDLSQMRWMHWIALLTIPLGYIAGQAGWVVAECGRQPWAIRDMLPTMAAISKLDVSPVAQGGRVQAGFVNGLRRDGIQDVSMNQVQLFTEGEGVHLIVQIAVNAFLRAGFVVIEVFQNPTDILRGGILEGGDGFHFPAGGGVQLLHGHAHDTKHQRENLLLQRFSLHK